MKYATIILLLIASHLASGQFKPGTYYFVNSDTTVSPFSEQMCFPELRFLSDKTFIYKHRIGCFLWYDSKGEWSLDKQKLILTDYVLGSNRKFMNDTPFVTQMMFRKTVFDIRGDSLLFTEQSYDRFKPDFYPMRNLSGNYLLKN